MLLMRFQQVIVDINQLILKISWKIKSPRLANTILKKTKVGGLMPTNFKIYYEITVSGVGERIYI